MAQVQAMPTVAQIAARIDRLPASRPLWSWVARISFGAFFEIYETALTSLLALLLVRVGIFHEDRGGLFGLPDLATFGFATFLGLFVGALVFSTLTDRVGRRPIFTYSLIWYAVATLIMGAQADALWICLWRLIAAIGVGAEIVAVDSYISEMLPKSMRGRGFAISKAIQYTAVPAAGILATLLAKKTMGSLQGWQGMLVVPTVGALLIWWVRRGLPESPRWLAGQGKLAAYFGFGNWLPSLLEARGVGVAKSLAYTAIIAFSYPLTPLLVSFMADRSERKWQIVWGAAVVAAAGLAFAAQSSVVGWITCGLLVTMGNNITSYATHTYRSELFPTNLRARGIGLVYSVDRIAAAFNSYLIGFILVEGGATAVLVAISAACLVAMVVVGLFGPRTRGVGVDQLAGESATA